MPITSTRSHRDERAELLPPPLLPLFDERFVVSCDLLEEYTGRLAAGVFRSIGLEEACREEASVEQAVARAELAPEVATVPVRWVLATLAARGCVAHSTGGGWPASLSPGAAVARAGGG